MTDAFSSSDLEGLRGNRRRRYHLAKVLAVVATMLCSSFGVLALPASATTGELTGTWSSVDVDGSNQTLRLGGSGNNVYSAFLRDDLTSGVCGGPPAKLVGTAVLEGDVLVVQGTLVCLPGGNPIPGIRVALSFEYDAEADTLTDEALVVWTR